MATPDPRGDLAVQFMRPDAALEGLVMGYHIYSAGPVGGPVWDELFFPGWANIRFILVNGNWQCGLVGEPLAPVPAASLFGPASRGINSRAHGGLMAGIGITPMGWQRLFDIPAYQVADDILPLSTLIGDCAPELHAALLDDPSPAAVKASFDGWLLARLRPPGRGDTLVRRLFDYLTDTHGVGITDMEAALGASHVQIRRIARTHFGFPSKLLLRRSRFLKSWMAIMARPLQNWSEEIDATYYDYSHFVRDCQLFLGIPPRQFLALDRPMTALSLANRAKVLGAPAQGLHVVRPTANRDQGDLPGTAD